MKIEPVKSYKKPAYAAAMAVLLTATGTLTGCGETALEGETSIVPQPTETTAATTEEVSFEGAVEIEPDTTEVELDGDVVMEPDSTVDVSVLNDD